MTNTKQLSTLEKSDKLKNKLELLELDINNIISKFQKDNNLQIFIDKKNIDKISLTFAIDIDVLDKMLV